MNRSYCNIATVDSSNMAVLLLIHAYEIFNKLMITILLFSVINPTGYDVIGPEKNDFTSGGT